MQPKSFDVFGTFSQSPFLASRSHTGISVPSFVLAQGSVSRVGDAKPSARSSWWKRAHAHSMASEASNSQSWAIPSLGSSLSRL